MFRCLMLLLWPLCQASVPPVITIGAVLSSDEHGQVFQNAVEKFSNKIEGTTLNSTYILMHDNPIRAAKAICEEIIPNQVYVVIASHPSHSDLSPMAVSFTCGYYKIPVIGISSRESAFSDKNVHSSFMRTVPPYSDQAEVWVSLIKYFGFKCVIFIHSSDQEGRAMLGKFQSKAETEDIKIEKNVQYISGYDNYTDELLEVPNLSARVILLFASVEDATVIYADAIRLNLTGAGYAWFVTEQALRPPNTPIGALGLQLIDADNEDAHIEDSVRLVVQALTTMAGAENITRAPDRCSDAGAGSDSWATGGRILRYLHGEEILHGRTGRVMFNDNGDRVNAVYDIVNIQPQSAGAGARRRDVGRYDPLQKHVRSQI